ncbi:hypothetical protein AGMMS50249_7970 [candidate division SR1 bacterium]|nr:hypothetical protein AGMMS50249_7970 [candidate division SR1 bacterium]
MRKQIINREQSLKTKEYMEAVFYFILFSIGEAKLFYQCFEGKVIETLDETFEEWVSMCQKSEKSFQITINGTSAENAYFMTWIDKYILHKKSKSKLEKEVWQPELDADLVPKLKFLPKIKTIKEETHWHKNKNNGIKSIDLFITIQ